MATKLQTTTIGSFPKPGYVPVRDWFDASRDATGMNDPTVTTGYDVSAEHEPLFVRAAREVLGVQIAAGIDVPTDGEVRRENYIHYHCRHLNGFDFDRLETRILRDGAYQTDLPAIRGTVSAAQPGYSVHDWKVAQDLCDRPVKATLPGPLTIMDTTADCHYADRPGLNKVLAETVNAEVLALAEAGCRYIQVDEPLFARQVDDALQFGLEGLERCFHGLPDGVTRVVHMCCGYPEHLDDETYKKADPDSYQRLSQAVDEAAFDQLSIEDAHCQNDLALLERYRAKSVILGAVAVARSRIEPVEEIADRISEALEHIDRDRLVIAPDCGLGLLTPDLADAKLRNMCTAATMV
ncbi:MAG: cobalamin-independent methionine synthase II family protein [Pseudomonadota bacterium]